MAGACTVRRLAALVLAGLACTIVLASAAHAQADAELARLRSEVSRLHDQGKYAEAIPVAERYLRLARRKHGEEHRKVSDALNWLGLGYNNQGRYAEAEPLYRRSLAIDEKALGSEHPDVAISLNNLASLYENQNRYAEAEPLYRRSVAVWEKALGPEHPGVATALNNLAGLYRAQGRYAEAERLYRRSLAIDEEALGPEHPSVATGLNNLAGLYQDQGRHAETEPLYERSLAITEKAVGPEHPDVAIRINNLASLYHAQGRYAEAEPRYRRSIAILEKALGPEHPGVARALNNLASLYRDQGRHAEAEPLYKRSLAVREKALGPEHPEVASSLNNLAELFQTEGRYVETEPLYKRSLAVREKALGPEHPGAATALNNLAGLYQDQRRHAEAEPLYKRSLAVWEKALGPEHPGVATGLNNLASLYHAQSRYAEAEPLYKRSLAVREKALGPEHPEVATSLNNLAELFRAQGRYAEAEPLYKRSLAVRKKALGPEHPDVAASLNNLASLEFGQSNWAQAVDYWRRSTSVIKRRTERGLSGTTEGSSKGDAQRLSWQFSNLIKAAYRLVAASPTTVLTAEMFETAQWALTSETATSLAQMAARSARDSPELGVLVRERQDLMNEWQTKDKLLIAAKSNEPAKRNADAERALANRMGAIDPRLAEINRRLAKDFPDYAALSSPIPAFVAEVQAQLGADEALVLILDTPERKPLSEESFLWVATKTDVRWVRSELGTAALTREVAALRCGVDDAAWKGAGRERCAKTLGMPTPFKAPGPLPFDHARAHKLYTALFGEVQDLIKGKHLLIVPSGPLTQLPFQVLVTRPAASGDHRAVAWLAREHTITVLPAVSSLKALRRVGRPSAAPKPMIGIGNPLLDGPDAHAADHAKLARAKQRCAGTRPQRVATRHNSKGRGAARVVTRGGLVNLADIKGQDPLPETADELCAVAHYVKADLSRDIHLGSQATEREVKRLSGSGELAKYRMLHFATHGTLAGEFTGTHEPGLILTPPKTATEEDDGYLSASEIAALKLDADWVVLSACNTAAGGATSAEALSGLGRAFIYAGARSLLVSHWAVDSDATVKLITGAVREMASDPKVGRAEAMRRSMLALIDKGTKEEAHPAFWAPFVVVGEGAAGR
jgi:tetratricopeptide (TPR) repeat protein/CHAT domain-containing protein